MDWNTVMRNTYNNALSPVQAAGKPERLWCWNRRQSRDQCSACDQAGGGCGAKIVDSAETNAQPAIKPEEAVVPGS